MSYLGNFELKFIKFANNGWFLPESDYIMGLMGHNSKNIHILLNIKKNL